MGGPLTLVSMACRLGLHQTVFLEIGISTLLVETVPVARCARENSCAQIKAARMNASISLFEVVCCRPSCMLSGVSHREVENLGMGFSCM